MTTINCKLLPPLNECTDLAEWKNYEENLYQIFQNTFLINTLSFQNKMIRIKEYPKYNNYETAFIHLICKQESIKTTNPNDREPDLRRAERLHWIKFIITSYPCLENCINCHGILLYKEYYNGNTNRLRIKLFLPIERYLIVLEERKNYLLLITAFYIDNEKSLNKCYSRYLEYKKQGTPIV